MNQDVSAFFCRIIAYLRMADYEFVKQSPDCQHEIWRRFSTFISVPKNCKSKHTANAIMQAANFPREY